MNEAALMSEAAAAWGDDWDRVVVALSRCVELAPWRADVRAKLGQAQGVLGESANAKRNLNLALDLEPDHPEYWADLGMVHFGVGEYVSARSLFEEAVARRPDFVRATVALVRCYQRLGDEIAMAAAAARAINLDPIGLATEEVKGIFASQWSRPDEDQRPKLQRLFRRQRTPIRPPSGNVGDFIAARDMDLGDAATSLNRVLTQLNPETADYCVVLETLANVHFELDRHDISADYSRRAIAGLKCVRALVAEPRQHRQVEAGREHDAKAAYEQLIREVLGEEPVLTVLVFIPGRTNDVRSATITTRSAVYDVDRGGNLFVITTPDGKQLIHEAFDRNDLLLAEW